MKQSKKINSGSVLVVTLISIAVGATLVGSLMKYSSQDYSSIEKEIGHTKASETLKLAMIIYNSSVEGEELTTAQLNTVKTLIGGGGSDTPIFGKTSGGTPSSIPGFEDYSVLWETSVSTLENTMTPPIDSKGFWYFEGTQTNTVKSTLSGDNVPAIRNNSHARYTSNNLIQVIPVFSMLSFYEKDWEISAHYESAQLIGHIHTNGSIFVDCRDSSNDRVSFHGLQNYPILTCNQYVYRRGRNGATSYYKFGTQANAGLDFYVYNDSKFNSLISASDFNYTKETSRIFTRDMTPDFTVYEEKPASSDTGLEPEYRRFGEGDVDTTYGYAFTGKSKITPTDTFDAARTPSGTYGVIQWDSADEDKKLNLSDSINPYQYIEDIQYQNTPDTQSYSPRASNYLEDSSMNNRIAAQAFNSIAPLVIRDGVAYYRTKPGGDLHPVMGLLTTNASFYPSSTHPERKRYADLRWYGWFGMNEAGSEPTPSNPARWHFPIKSVTFNATKDINNAGSASNSAEGSAVAFTFRSADIHNPVTDGVRDGSGNVVAPKWIRTDIDMTGLNGYPPSDNTAQATQAAVDTATGAGIGMFNVSYPTIDGDNYERYDPVRVGYNVVKSEIRKLYNACHIYTSAHDGTRMLNKDFSDPGAEKAPDIWGTGANSMQDDDGVDYDNADGDSDDTTGKDYSSFWNDDGAQITGFEYMRFVIRTPTSTSLRIHEIEFRDASNSTNYPVSAMTSDTGPSPLNATASSGSNVYKVFDNINNSTSNYWTPSAAASGSPAIHWIKIKLEKGILPNRITVYATRKTSGSPTFNGPTSFYVEGSTTGAFTGEQTQLTGNLTPSSWSTSSVVSQNFSTLSYTFTPPSPKYYQYQRDQSTTNTDASAGTLSLGSTEDATPKIELFPIRHKSLCDTGTDPTAMTDWYIYRSTLPLCDRTLQMPATRNALTDVPTSSTRKSNFGYGINFPNWLTLACNAPEMLARKSSSAVTFETPDKGFSYYAGDCGGYYGNDNLCMIDGQEKKILAFTEIDLSELTPECFKFNGLETEWGFNFDTNDASVNDSNSLQNIIYVVNTTMGKNFFGKRVHCGGVRLKRGAVIPFKLSIATPNALHIWGDFNCPGYWHHGKNSGNGSVSYWVPSSREHAPGTSIPVQSVGLYADNISAYENSWIPFDQSDGNTNSDDLTKNTAVSIGGKNYYYGCFQNTVDYRTNEAIFYDHKLWWEDDGMRREGTNSVSAKGAQLFLNYHEMIFNHVDNDCYKLNSAWGDNDGASTNNRNSSNQIWKHVPIGINAALMYGNVESRLPSYFKDSDVTGIPVNCPSSIDKLDWYMSWIPRAKWQETKRDWMINTKANTITNGGFDPSVQDDSSFYKPAQPLSLSNYYGTAFPGSTNEMKWENCKLKFCGGGMLYDIRYHTSQEENLSETVTRQDFGRNIRGAFTCIFESRQGTHGWNNTMLGTESQQTFYSYDMNFNTSSKLPPGTPMTTVVGKGNYSIEGAKWEY